MSYLADVVVVGGTGGSPFEFDGTTTGATLKKIWVWVTDRQVKSMRFWFSDDQSRQFGDPAGNFSEFSFKKGELFTSLSLWARDDGKRLAAFKFNTNQSREFSARVTKAHLKEEVPVDVASGICIGVQGHSGADIDRLGFMFINPIKYTKLTDVEYPTLHDEIPKVAVREIKSTSYENNSSVPQEYKIETTMTMTQKSSWSVTGKLEMTVNLEVKTGIPGIAEGNTGFEFKLGIESTYASETTEEKTELFSFPVQVPAGKTLDVNITIGEATVDLPFKGVVKITCYNDSVLQFNTSGTYKGVTYTEAKVVASEPAKHVA